MRQDRRLRQQVVVCKMAAGEPGGVEVLRLPRLAPELSCCLQDCGGGASGPGVAVVRGSGRRRRDSSAGTASSNRDCRSAISGGCPGRPPSIRIGGELFPVIHGAAPGTRFRRGRPSDAGVSKASPEHIREREVPVEEPVLPCGPDTSAARHGSTGRHATFPGRSPEGLGAL